MVVNQEANLEKGFLLNASLRTELPFLGPPITALGSNKVVYCPKSLLPGGIAGNSVVFLSVS